MEAIFSFFSCFMYQYEGIFISNIAFVGLVLKKGRLRIEDKKSSYFFLVFLLAAIISTFSFNIKYGNLSSRNIVQLIFNLEYFIFCCDFGINFKKIAKWYLGFAALLSIYIAILFIYLEVYNNLSNIFASGRMWGDSYIPGWPNSTPLPMVFATFILMKDETIINRRKIVLLGVYFIGILLTSSRGGLLAEVVIMFYFLAIRGKVITIKKVVGFTIVVLAVSVGFIILMRNESFAYRVTVTWDRQEIAKATIAYVKSHPFFGYGGNSFDYVYDKFGSQYATVNWGQTHNTLLELLLRYGIIGASSFVLFIVSIYKKIKDKDTRMMFILLWGLSLIQMHFRNFVFISGIYMLIKLQNMTLKTERLKE